MSNAIKCPRCRQTVPDDAPLGLCPACLLKGAVDISGSVGDSDSGEVPRPGAVAEPPGTGTRSETWNDLCETASYQPSKRDPPRRAAGQRGVPSSATVDLDQFIGALIEVRLMDRDEIQAFLERYSPPSRPSTAEHMARELVKVRRLTEYQAGALVQGKSRGLSIGNYLVLDKLGTGGMGMVFKAQHRRMKRVVALKVLPPSYSKSESAVLRFQREAEAVARLGHPNIVAALDSDELNGLHFFAMEYVEGRDLTRLVSELGPLPVDQAIEYLTQAARGLKAAHDKGIYHRDIKPSNLMLDVGGTVKVLDLGLARMSNESDQLGSPEAEPALTRVGDIMGTVAFMSPEQAYNAKDADHRSDIYSLGCTLYYLLAGRPPYSGVTRMACLLAHREQPIPHLRDVRPDVPPRVDLTLSRMMAKAPEDRYGSIAELILDLQACRDPGSSDPAWPGRVLPERAGASFLAPEAAPHGGTSSRPSTTPRAWLRSGLVAAVVLVAILGTVALNRRRPSAPEPLTIETTGSALPIEKDEPKVVEAAVEAERKAPPKPAEPIGENGSFRFHEPYRVQSIAVSDSQGRSFALSGGDDRTICYWDLATDRTIYRFPHEGQVFAVALSSSGRRLALSGGFDRIMRLWDLENGREEGRFHGHEQPIYSVSFSGDGRRVLSGSGDHTVRLWDATNGEKLDRLEHAGPVTSVAFAPVGTRALSGSDDRSVRLWDFWNDKGKEIASFEGPAPILCVTFAPDGHRAVTGAKDGCLSVWNIDSQTLTRRLESPTGDWVRCVAFLPDNRHVLSGTQNGALIVWDIDALRQVRRFEGKTAHLGVAAMSDGVHALTADADGLVRRWSVAEPPKIQEP